ncbi:MAG: bL35 family ribosomal protein [bacterium]|nr:bL35 family ribosomal protein [bacterium]
MSQKTNKSLSKRLKVTKNGKLVARKAGHNHFNSRDDARASLRKRGTRNVVLSAKTQSRFLPGTPNANKKK